MSIDTATVQTMTAEVRVLMVGSRQITLSVAKQLDRVQIEELKIFGRVRINEDHLVIGSAADGTLALASYSVHPPNIDAVVYLPKGLGRFHYCGPRRTAGRERTTDFTDERVVFRSINPFDDIALNLPCPTHKEGIHQTVFTGNQSELEGLIDKAKKFGVACEEAIAAPLIVLAGLK